MLAASTKAANARMQGWLGRSTSQPAQSQWNGFSGGFFYLPILLCQG